MRTDTHSEQLPAVSNRVCCLLLQVAMAGDFILAVASMMIARLRDDDVTITLSQVHVCVHVCLLYLFAGRASRQTCLHVWLDEQPHSQKYRFWVHQNVTRM